MTSMFVIIKSNKIWKDLFFTTEESARNHIAMNVHKSHAVVETEHNKFVSKRYGSRYYVREVFNSQSPPP